MDSLCADILEKTSAVTSTDPKLIMVAIAIQMADRTSLEVIHLCTDSQNIIF